MLAKLVSASQNSQGLILPPRSHSPYSRRPAWHAPRDAACYRLIAAQFPRCKAQTDGACTSALSVVGSHNRACWHFQYLLLRLPCVDRGTCFILLPWKGEVLRYRASVNHWITASGYLFWGAELAPQEPLSLTPFSSTSWLHCLDNNEEPSLAVSMGYFVHASAQKDSCWSFKGLLEI